MNYNHLVPMPPPNERKRFMLVYQGGIANVFEVKSFNLADFGREAKRLYQGDFRTAEAIATGAGLAGAIVISSACNKAGDISSSEWTGDLESQPFAEKFHPVFFVIGI